MNKKILVGSLQYSPIYKSHCCALGKQCEKYGFSVKYLFSNKYEWMLPHEIKNKTYFIGNSSDISSAFFDGINFIERHQLKMVISKEKPDYVYMYNYHPFFNYHIAKLSKKYDCAFIQHIHEPYVEDKSVYGCFSKYWLTIFESSQEKLLDKTDIVVTSSKIAQDLFDKRYTRFTGKKVFVPLIYEDVVNYSPQTSGREYITFIGPLVSAKGPETFLDVLSYCETHNFDFKFLLITRKKINDSSFTKRSNLRIFYKDQITDDEINTLLKNSMMTIAPYKVATQSSVVLTSFMNGTPVLATKIGGLPEVVHHLENGYLVDKGEGIEEWMNGIFYIQENLSKMTSSCRNYFTNEFSESNWSKYIPMLFN